MLTLNEIMAAVDELRPSQLVRLRKRIERREQKVWEEERAQVAAQLRKANINDDYVNELVVRRRREKCR